MLNMTPQQAKASLPAELHSTFDELVRDYEEACKTNVKGGRVYRNYGIFADLIHAGWRKSQPPLHSK